MTVKISIVTVAKNAEATIADTLRSVADQCHKAVEHILIDGASTDRTMDIVEREGAHLAQVVSEPDQGLYDAMNKGIALAKGQVVGTLNADDVYAHKNVLAKVATNFAQPDLQACFSDLVYVQRKDPARVVRYWKSQPFEPGLFARGWIPAHPTFFVRRDVYQELGGFDLRYRLQSDFELTMRFLEVHRIKSVYVPEVWVCMRMGGATNNSLINLYKGNMESFRACRRHGIRVGPWFFVSKFAMRIPQFFRRPESIVSTGDYG